MSSLFIFLSFNHLKHIPLAIILTFIITTDIDRVDRTTITAQARVGKAAAVVTTIQLLAHLHQASSNQNHLTMTTTAITGFLLILFII